MARDVYGFPSVASLRPDSSRILKGPYGSPSQPSSAPPQMGDSCCLLTVRLGVTEKCPLVQPALTLQQSFLRNLLVSCRAAHHSSLWKSALKSRNRTESPVVPVPPRNAKPPRGPPSRAANPTGGIGVRSRIPWRLFSPPAARTKPRRAPPPHPQRDSHCLDVS